MLVRVLYHPRILPLLFDIHFLCLMLFLAPMGWPCHDVPRVPILNSTRLVSFNARQSSCYSVIGHKIMEIQAKREGGQFLILSPVNRSAAALSTLPSSSSSEGKVKYNLGNSQEHTKKFHTTRHRKAMSIVRRLPKRK